MIDPVNVVLRSFYQFYNFLSRVTSTFRMQANHFLEFSPSVKYLFEAATLAHKQKVRIFEMAPNQFLISVAKASFELNCKPSPHLTQFLHVSAGL